MGAAVALELSKPVDAKDITDSGSLEYAKNEVIRLRQNLSHLAEKHGMKIMTNDASDLIHGSNETDDFNRCVDEVKHIRACLQLNTQTSKRRNRVNIPNVVLTEMYNPAFAPTIVDDDNHKDDGSDSDSDSGSDSDCNYDDNRRSRK